MIDADEALEQEESVIMPAGSLHIFPFWLEIIIHSTQYMNGMAMTPGVFKAYALTFFYSKKCNLMLAMSPTCHSNL